MNISVRRGMGLAALLTVSVGSPALAQGTIPQWNWTLLSVDSQDLEGGNYAAVNAFDSDPATMWVDTVVSAVTATTSRHSDRPWRAVQRQPASGTFPARTATRAETSGNTPFT